MPIKFTSMHGICTNEKDENFCADCKERERERERESEFSLKKNHKKKAPKPSFSFFLNQSTTWLAESCT
jgi:hypothetical protein